MHNVEKVDMTAKGRSIGAPLASPRATAPPVVQLPDRGKEPIGWFTTLALGLAGLDACGSIVIIKLAMILEAVNQTARDLRVLRQDSNNA